MNDQQDQTNVYQPTYDPLTEAELQEQLPPDQVNYTDYSQTGFEEEEYSDYNEELDDTHRFHIAMNVFDMISVLAGLAVVLVLAAILISLITWLQTDINHSFTLLTSQLQ